MGTPSAAEVKAILVAATYPANTLDENNIFDYPQKESRRRYPSCEIQLTQPDSTIEDKRQTFKVSTMEIRYYKKLLAAGSDEVVESDSVQAAIIGALEAATLQNHKIVLETKIWSTIYVQADQHHPNHVVSTLRVAVREITRSTAVADGFLIFDVSASSVDNAPGSDYTYTKVFDVDVSEGYRTIQEQVTLSPDGKFVPIIYPGGFNGRFIGNVPVKDSDLGTTGEKLNKLMSLRSTGIKPSIGFVYTDKDNQEVPQDITDSIKIVVDQIQRLYRYQDMVVYRILGTVVKPSSIVVS